jgi:BASS family bile acid:Na+ symporter
MTAISSLISFISIPLILTKIAPIIGLMNAVKIDLNFLKLSFVLFVISTVPIVLGILTNTKFNNFSQSVSPLINKSAILLFIITILVAWYSDFEMSLIAYKEMFLVLIVLMLLVLIYVNILVKALKINVRDSKTIITETFIQNGAMGILIGSSIFGLGSGYLMMSAIYGLFQYKLFLVWYLVDKKINKLD